MWRRGLILALCTVFASGNVTAELHGTTSEVLNIGDTLHTAIKTFILSDNFTCYLETPQKETIVFGTDEDWDTTKYNFVPNTVYGCQVIVNITSVADSGYWRLYYVLNKTEDKQGLELYNVTVNSQDSEEAEADITDDSTSAEKQDVQIFDSHFFNSRIGVEHTITIVKVDSIQTVGCYIITPNDELYHKPELPKQSSVEWVEESHLACGVKITVETEDMIGNWTLFSTDIRNSEPFERRQPFRIYIEEITDMTESEKEPMPTELTWREGFPVDIDIGPADVVYCRVISPTGDVVKDGIGRCHINIQRVSKHHTGSWIFTIGTPGNIKTKVHKVLVYVERFNSMHKVKTLVTNYFDGPAYNLTCMVPGIVRSCHFMQPNGAVLLAPVGELSDLIENNVTLNTIVDEDTCSLRITNPVDEQFGFWRCFIQIENDTAVYSNYLEMTSIWGRPQELKLTAAYSFVEGVEGNALTMSCLYPSAIHYCYFRAPNGTVYNVVPEMQHEGYEYLGSGFFIGECGIKFNNIFVQDSGNWSCHVGPLVERATTTVIEEETAEIEVMVSKLFQVTQTENGSAVIVGGFFNNYQSYESCRFVRADGLGFTSVNLPYGYKFEYYVEGKRGCGIVVDKPDKIDLQPWTVVVRLSQGNEVWGRTDGLLSRNSHRGSSFIQLWGIVTWLCLIALFLAVMRYAILIYVTKKEISTSNPNQVNQLEKPTNVPEIYINYNNKY